MNSRIINSHITNFNSALWDTRKRQWNTSRNLGQHIKLESKKDENLEFISMGMRLNENIRDFIEDKEAIHE